MKCPTCGNQKDLYFGRESGFRTTHTVYRCFDCGTQFEEFTGRIVGNMTTTALKQLMFQIDQVIGTINHNPELQHLPVNTASDMVRLNAQLESAKAATQNIIDKTFAQVTGRGVEKAQ